MTFDKRVKLRCDADGCLESLDTMYSSARAARMYAPDGWSNYGRWDYCPDHSPSDNGHHER